MCKQLIVDSIDFEGHFQSFSRHQYNFWIWVFGPSKHFLGKKWLSTPVEMILSIKRLSTKNFSSKFQLWVKMNAAPPGSQTQIKKISRKTSSGMFKGTKNMFPFFGHFFNSFWPVQANAGSKNFGPESLFSSLRLRFQKVTSY